VQRGRSQFTADLQLQQESLYSNYTAWQLDGGVEMQHRAEPLGYASYVFDRCMFVCVLQLQWNGSRHLQTV
jgi:hypothetical protein